MKIYFQKIKKHSVIVFLNTQHSMNKIDWKNAIKFDGFSDHTLGIIAPIIFTILKKIKNSKKIYIEKHVKLKNSKGT